MRRQLADLPDIRRRRINVQNRKALIEDAQYQFFDYDELPPEAFDAEVTRILGSITDAEQRQELQTTAEKVAEQRRELLNAISRRYNSYLDTLFELDATEQLLIRETQSYQSYIDERVLWIRSNRTLLSSIEVDPSDTWVFDAARWSEAGQQVVSDMHANPLVYGLGLLAFALLFWQVPRFVRELATIGQAIRQGRGTEFLPTLRAGSLTLMLAVVWPGLIFFLGWRLSIAASESQFTHALAQGLLAIAWLYFPLELLRQTCRPSGLADSHFGWPATSIAVLRSNLRWITLLGFVAVFSTAVLYASDPEHGSDVIERLCFVAGMGILAIFVRRALRTESGLLREYLEGHRDGWADRLRFVWYWGCVLLPLVLAGMAIAGYYYTAQQLTWRFYASLLLVVVVQLLKAFLSRLLLVRRRSISIEQARERRTAERERGEALPELGPEQIVPPEELQVDVAANMEQTQRLIKTGVLAVSLVGMWLIWVDVVPALRMLDQGPVWTAATQTTPDPSPPSSPSSSLTAAPVGEPASTATTVSTETPLSVTVADVGLALVICIVTFICAPNIPGLMELSVLERLPLDKSIRYAVTSITSYVIVLIGMILAFNAISIGWSKVQWLATALFFGLAFGLQEIFANFVAGLILLFERPLRVGDVVTVDTVSGVVSRIRIRATIITDWDRKEYVIPNKEFITGRLLNWTLSDKTNRILINVGVAYGSDVECAKQLLLETCQNHPLTLDEPPTRVTFEGFGDNSLNLVVRTFLPNLDNRLTAIDELHTSIDRVFREAGIEIAFPQRDLHLRSIDPSVWNETKERGNPVSS